MYTLKYNGQLLHDPRTKDRFVRAPSFRLVVGEAGSGTFTVDSTNPALAALRRMSGQVELLQDGSPIYRGRILRDTTDFYQSREIVTEGAMAYLNDSLVPPFNYPEDYPEAEGAENTVAVLFNWFLDIHNASVSEDQQIKPGVVTVTDPNNYIARSSDKYLSTLEAIRTRLVNTMGGYLLMRYEPDGNYLDYYAELPLTNTQPIRYGQNLLDLVQECDGSEIYTAILPTGANGIDISGELDGDITPDLVKEGKIIYSRSGREQFGNITRLVEFQDVTEAANLKSKAARQLALGFGTKATITCQAADLGFTESEIPNFRVGRNTFVYSNPHGLSAAFPLMEMELDINNPGATPITLGGTSISFTGNAVNDNRGMAEASETRFNQLRDHFNKSYKDLCDKIDGAIELLGHKMRQFDAARMQIPNCALLYPELQKQYMPLQTEAIAICEHYSKVISDIIDVLYRKKSDMINDGYVNEFLQLVNQLSFDYSTFDALLEILQKHNQKNKEFYKSIEQAQAKIEYHHISEFSDEIDSFEKTISAKAQEKNNLYRDYLNQKAQIDALEQEVKNTQIPADEINRDIAFIMGRSELVFTNSDLGYKVTRNGKKAKNLSKGEENAIALVYFFNTLLDVDADAGNSIIVLDDPISSFDSNFYSSSASLDARIYC